MTENSNAKELDSYTCELSGRNMVSAGAGTGKTYNIQILVLRQILSGTAIEKILVVTFTNLAVDELRDRLRRILKQALDLADFLLVHGIDRAVKKDDLERINDWKALTDDERKQFKQVLPLFVTGTRESGKTEAQEVDIPLREKRERLVIALRNFDSAPISTIHGFCSRMLEENAFESGLRYGMELRKSCKALIKSILSDFYRSFSSRNPSEADTGDGFGNEHKNVRQMLLSMLKMTPEKLRQKLQDVLANPDAKVTWGEGVPDDVKMVEDALEKIERSQRWFELNDDIRNADEEQMQTVWRMIEDGKLSKGITSQVSEEGLEEQREMIEALGDNALPWSYERACNVGKNLTDICKIVDGNKVRKADVRDAILQEVTNVPLVSANLDVFYDAANGDRGTSEKRPSLKRLLGQYERLLARLAYEELKNKLSEAKLREGFMTFDDLLLKLKNRLEVSDGKLLCETIQKQYSCVMIDEFQDTDSCQSAIFNTLFETPVTDGAEEGGLRSFFMIGDEKQAIYKFRGGDVQTFQQEKNRVEKDRNYTLNCNYRSSEDFIEAMNVLWPEDDDPEFFNPYSKKDTSKDSLEDASKDSLEDASKDSLEDASKDSLEDTSKETDFRIEMKKIIFGGKINAWLFLKNDSEKRRLKGDELLNIVDVGKGGNVYSTIAKKIQGLVKNVQIQEKIKDEETKESHVEEKDIHYGDIAILMRRMSKLKDLQRELEAAGIPSVVMRGQSIFRSEMCDQMSLLMDAVINPGDASKAMILLGSSLFEFSAVQLEYIRQTLLGDCQLSLKNLSELWQRKSFYAMFNEFLGMTLNQLFSGKLERCGNDDLAVMSETTVSQRIVLMLGGDGLSKIIQLAENLMAVAEDNHYGQAGLLAFLAGKVQKNHQKQLKSWGQQDDDTTSVDEEEDDDEEFPVHLTTQDNAVKILTIHKSKGLQFPFVFVPEFSVKSRKAPVVYHEKIEETEAIKRNDKIEKNKAIKRKINIDEKGAQSELCQHEEEEESRRLMYVAITRAIFLCHFVSQKKEKEEQPEFKLNVGPDTFLLASSTAEEGDNKPNNASDVVAESFTVMSKELHPGWVSTSFSQLTKNVGKNISYEENTKGNDNGSGDAAGVFDDGIRRQVVENSHVEAQGEFGGVKDDDDVDDDSSQANGMMGGPVLVPYAEREPIFQFPGGKRTGTCWHEVFEHLDFAAWGDGANEAREASWNDIETRLQHYGQFSEATKGERCAAFQTMLENVCTMPLKFTEDGQAIQLCDVPANQTKREFGFTYLVREGLEGKELWRLLGEHGVEVPDDWSHKIGQTALTGSLDLLFMHNDMFYIIDWKTNIIGADRANFTQEGVANEMKRHFYKLQCVLYALAFIQYYRQYAHGKDLMGKTGDELETLMEVYGKEAYSRFGGCIDIFVRGANAKTGSGAFAFKPSYELLQKLDKYIGVKL